MASRSMKAVALLLASSLPSARVSATSLPSVHASSEGASEVRNQAKWWADVGGKLYYAPPASMAELSGDVSDYYYALGSESALSDTMRQHRVGGEGRVHIFHLPKGPSMLQIQSRGDRRESMSSLLQLQHGVSLGTFPEYPTQSGYQYPGDQSMQNREKSAAAAITPVMYKEFLTQITELPGQGVGTRSWSNDEASKMAQEFLIGKFKAMGLKTCLQTFTDRGHKLANVVAIIPGSSTAETLTVGAHYDSRPFNGKAPGAEDNGSGVAALLAMAKAFTSANLKPKRSMYLVGFAAEEPGLLGSKEFAHALAGIGGKQLPEACLAGPAGAGSSFLQRTTADKHQAIVMDEVGWVSKKLSKRTINLESKDWTKDVMNHLAEANLFHNGQELYVVHNNAPFGSDHMSFLDNGMKGVLVINGDDEGYPNYHKSTDTIENVNADYAAEVTKMVFGGAVRVAGLQA